MEETEYINRITSLGEMDGWMDGWIRGDGGVKQVDVFIVCTVLYNLHITSRCRV